MIRQGILIAYGEMFLKSKGVKEIFQRRLIKNLEFFLKEEKACPPETKEEYKGHAGTELEVSVANNHIHTVNENDKVSSYDDDHKHDVNWDKMILEEANGHTHTIERKTIEVKATEKEDKVFESPLEKTMKLFMKEIDKESKEIIKESGEEW